MGLTGSSVSTRVCSDQGQGRPSLPEALATAREKPASSPLPPTSCTQAVSVQSCSRRVSGGWYFKSGVHCRPGGWVGRLCHPVGGEAQQCPFEGLLGSQRPLAQVPGCAPGLRALSVVLNPLSSVFKPLQAGSRWGRRACRRREADREFPEPPLGVGHSVLVARAPRASAVHWTVAEHLPSA